MAKVPESGKQEPHLRRGTTKAASAIGDGENAGTGTQDQKATPACGTMGEETSVTPDFIKEEATIGARQRRGGSHDVSLDQSVQSAIGRQLRTMFDEIAQAPVPERFLQLLAELERRQKGR